MAVKKIPDGYHSVTPYLIVDDASGLIDFAKKVFRAEEMFRMPTPEGKIGHAEMKIGDSVVMVADAATADGNTAQPATLLLYLDDCDASYRQALDAGGTSEREPADQFYGDRSAGVSAFGITWWLHTHVEDVSPEEMEKRAATAMAGAQS
jgi:PhnB protein